MKKQNKENARYPKIELLAPGGDVLAVKAAILAGADAVYCGLPEFNARRRADNISLEQLKKLIVIAHQQGVKLYLTLNTLILENEFDTVVELLGEVERSGIDAVIVQDAGLIKVIREHFPALELHASTQLTTHNAGQLRLLARYGVVQVNLSRELSLDEVADLSASAAAYHLKSEVFVHGAYCISFSGQCYFSSAMSGLSGNRGACVQPCRRIWHCTERGDTPGNVPFNLRDNSAFARVKQLAGAGVGSVKIEGRIKNYAYVYATVSAWRRQLDRFYGGESPADDDPALHAVFNRSFHSGYLDRNISKSMFIDTSRDQSLVRLSTILSYTADTGILKLEREIDVEDTVPVLIYSEGFTFVCSGEITGRVHRHGYKLRITHKLRGKIKSGDTLYRQGGGAAPDDLLRRCEQLQVKRRKLDVTVYGSVGTPLAVRFTVDDTAVTVTSETMLTAAKTKALTGEVITEKMAMLGDTEFVLEKVDTSELDEGIFLPISILNDLRRRGIAGLTRGTTLPARSVPVAVVRREAGDVVKKPPLLALLVNDRAGLQLKRCPETKCCFELPVTAGGSSEFYRKLFREYPDCIPWFPAILIGDHFTAAVKLLRLLRPPMIITDNSGIGDEAGAAGIPWVAGPLLNTTNSHALSALREQCRCAGAFISHELSRDQMAAVSAPAGFSRWYTLFGPLLLMNTRQCIVRNCSTCTRERVDAACIASCSQEVTLHDGKGHPVFIVKRPGFYNQVYNGRHYFCPSLPADIERDNALFLCDLRAIPSQTTVTGELGQVVKYMETLVTGDCSAGERLRSILRTTTAGQYSRGI